MLLRLLLALVVIVSAAVPVLGGDEQDCFQGQEPELRIKGCSEFIQRAPNDTAGYHNRAEAHALAGDIDDAIADYTKVIEIAPDNASAYENRGRAYASKGENALAAQDQSKAQELMGKAIAQPYVDTPKASVTANAPKKAKSQAKAKAATKANEAVAGEAPTIGFWSWLVPGNSNADQAGGKKTKP